MGSFIPSNSSRLRPPWTTVQLSQRDVSLDVPINFLTQPAVSLSAACFGAKVYDEEAAKRCVSNLLSVGYRRLHVDLYWSTERRQWSICPVTIPAHAIEAVVHPTSSLSSVPRATLSKRLMSTLKSLRCLALNAKQQINSRPVRENLHNLCFRQPAISPSTEPHGASIVGRTDIPTRKGPFGTVLYQLGPYSCSASVDITGLMRVVADYFRSTENTLNAHLTYLIFNVHAASSLGTAEGRERAPTEDQLSSPSESLSAAVQNTLGTYLYSPAELESDRRDLNKSWYSVAPSMRPVTGYFTIHGNANSYQETPDGWPTEGYVELSKARRLLLGWGTIDPQMKAYNLSEDSHVVFSTESISAFVAVTKDRNNTIKNECFYSSNTTDVGHVRTWVSDEIPDANSLAQLSRSAEQMVSCGVSPFVNHTLLNVTADQDIEPYRNVSLSSIWSWVNGEPQNSTKGAISDGYRCSVMDLSLSGRWRATNCTDRLYAACRIGNSPFEWTLSNESVAYTLAGGTCPRNSTFAVPRTALENTYLYKFLLKEAKRVVDPSSEGTENRNIWIDFNSFDVPTCWVSGGPKAQCPYEIDESAIERRNILVPSIAAIIILIITALTLFVKCNANRRNSRRRRVIEGWEYEGVPS
ncbi:Maintenance of telomere capping protein 6 [Emydomyces testavorans]|uniref:Maintenance of telomere capping protein 6 n=1 Tax=Emydomyces testavorans TaxID=2070801 RepID=A0AAF0II16_9EURO|nr:Maintenance of telomere capping protein 6 [Emydomyces testavorans]